MASLTSSTANNRVRIIGGRWRKSVVTFPDLPGLRPTPDRVRETVMNWLGQQLDGWHVLDAFAGTGAFALECASRGAARVVALDAHPLAVKSIAAAALRLGGEAVVQAERADALVRLRGMAAEFDLVILDPPFDANLYDALAELAPKVLKPTGVLYVESPRALETFGAEMVRIKSGRAGLVHFHLFAHVAMNVSSPT